MSNINTTNDCKVVSIYETFNDMWNYLRTRGLVYTGLNESDETCNFVLKRPIRSIPELVWEAVFDCVRRDLIELVLDDDTHEIYGTSNYTTYEFIEGYRSFEFSGASAGTDIERALRRQTWLHPIRYFVDGITLSVKDAHGLHVAIIDGKPVMSPRFRQKIWETVIHIVAHERRHAVQDGGILLYGVVSFQHQSELVHGKDEESERQYRAAVHEIDADAFGGAVVRGEASMEEAETWYQLALPPAA